MALELFVPEVIGNKGAGVKDLVVLILSSEFPLSTKQIHNLLLRKYSLRISFQATHKALTSLSSKGVIKKIGKEYSLDRNWISKLRFFVNDLEKSYFFLKGLPVIEKESNLSLNFDTISDVDRFILAKLESFPLKEKKVRAVANLNHLWWPLFYSFKEFLQINTINKKIDLTINCKGNTHIDKWCAKYYSNLGFVVNTGHKNTFTNDIIIFGDYIIQIFYPKAVVSKIEKVFSSNKNVEDLNIVSFYTKIFEKKMNIQVLINQNPELATELGQ
ncbi:MAG: hypothetical protein PHD05_01330 [Sphaerochaetaceae bacterium]|nr:hypothetical protein [Sphaerochaetaceae bacterium]